MRVHPWLVIVSVLLCATGIDGAAPEPDIDDTRVNITANTRVAVHVYAQSMVLNQDDERIALDVAKKVFATASLDLAWTLCLPGICVTPSSEALKLRIVMSSDRGEPSSRVLGQSLIDSRARAGVLATVFIDRTRRLAQGLATDYRTLLGRAIAHELGHLLLGTSTHSVGLMREIWSHDELLGARPADWVLAPPDAAIIRERLARRGNGRVGGAS
jgi:hypothetical protein